MTRSVCALALTCCLAGVLCAQATPHFEVASVKPSPPDPPAGTAGLKMTQRQARFSFLSLKDYIGVAYGVRVYQIIGPDWIAGARFDVIATIPDGRQQTDLPGMMAALLEERFHMKSHRENRDFPVYALETMPGFKLEPIPSDTPADGTLTVTSTTGPDGTAVDLGDGASLAIGNNRIEAKKVTFAQFAAVLERFVDRPVVDQTKREGRFNIAIDLMPGDFQAAMIRSAVAAGISLPGSALRLLDSASAAAVPDAMRPLGLALQARKAPLEVLVVDSVDRTPTEN